jgi:trimeric autotransporter adhesin
MSTVKQTISNSQFLSTTNATNTSTGSVNILGGASVQKDLYIGGNTYNSTGTVTSTNYTGNNVSIMSATTGSFVATNISATNIQLSSLTVGTLSTSTQINTNTTSVSFVESSSASIGTLMSTLVSTGTLNTTTLIGTNANILTLTSIGTLNVSSNVSSTNAQFAALSVTNNVVSTNVSTSTITITNASVQNSMFTNVSAGTLFTTNWSSGTVIATTFTGNNLAMTGAVSTGTLVATNVSTTNLLATNATVSAFSTNVVSSGSANITGVTVSNINITGTFNQNNNSVQAQWTTNGNTLFYTKGNVGINTTAPTVALDVSGASRVVSGMTVGNLYVNGLIYQSGAPFTGNTSSSWVTYTSGNVGIDTSSPSYTLDIAGTNRVQNTQYISSGSVLITNNINTYGNMVNATANSFYITTDPKTTNARLRTSRANANNAVSSWTTQTSQTNTALNSICWAPELPLFVAMSNTGTVVTSSDAMSWTTQTAPNTSWSSVCFSSELTTFVAVSNAGIIASSTNGTVWTTQTAQTTTWSGVCWSSDLSLFVAVSNAGVIASSPTGTVWTTQTAPVATWNAVCYSSELNTFVAVSNGVTIASSANGTTWTTYTAPSSNWNSVTFSGELGTFVAVSGTALMTSTDAINWVTRTIPTTGYTSVCWSNELSLYIAVGSAATMSTSSDAVTWITTGTAVATLNAVCWSAEFSRYVSVGANGTVQISNSALPNSKSAAMLSQTDVNYNNATSTLNINNASVTTVTTNNAITTNVSAATLTVTNATLPSTLAVTNVTSGTVYVSTSITTSQLGVSNATVTNLNTTNVSASTFTATNMTTANMNANVTTSTLNVSTSTIANLVATNATMSNMTAINVTVPTLLTTTLMTGGTLNASTVNAQNASLGSLGLTNGTINNTFTMSIGTTAGNINAYTMSTGNLNASSVTNTPTTLNVSYGNANVLTVNTSLYNAYMSNATVSSMKITSGMTASNAYILNITSGAINTSAGISTASLNITTTAPVLFGTVSSTLVTGTTVSLGNMYISGNTNIAGTLLTTNITTANATETNVSSGNVLNYTSLTATGANNTLGNLFTTTTGVGINTKTPGLGYTLDVSGSIRARTSVTAGNINTVNTTVQNVNTVTLSAASGVFTTVSSGSINITGNLYQNNVVYSANASSSWTTAGNNAIYYTGGNVGIGLTAPNTQLSILNTMNIANATSTASLGLTGTLTANPGVSTTNATQVLTIGGPTTTFSVGSLAKDNQNNVILVGNYIGTSANVYATNGTTVLTTYGNGISTSDIVIAKYSSTGNLVYTNRIGGTLADTISALTTDAQNNVIVGGYTASTQCNFYATNGTSILTTMGSGAFVAKFDSTGNYVYSNILTNASIGQLTTDINNNVYCKIGMIATTSNVYATNGTSILGTYGNLGSTGSALVKFDSIGNYMYSLLSANTNMTGNSTSITTDVQNNVFATGIITTNSVPAPFYATNGTTIVTNISSGAGGNLTSYIVKYNSVGSLVSSYMFNPANTISASFAVTNAVNNLVIGYECSAVTPAITFGSLYASNGTLLANIPVHGNYVRGCTIVALSSSGNYLYSNLISSTIYTGAAGNVWLSGITTDQQNNVLAGITLQTGITIANVYASNGSTVLATLGNLTTSQLNYLVKFDSIGNYLSANALGGSSVSTGTLLTDSQNNVYLTANATSTMNMYPVNNMSTYTMTQANNATRMGALIKYQATTGVTYANLVTDTSGNLTVYGTLNVSGTKNFKIPHPVPEKRAQGYTLLHSALETPTRGDNMYRYRVITKNNKGTVTLPDYFSYLNEDVSVICTPIDNFGLACGVFDIVANTVSITSDTDGAYTVLVIGTRKDPNALLFDTKGIEYIEPKSEPESTYCSVM